MMRELKHARLARRQTLHPEIASGIVLPEPQFLQAGNGSAGQGFTVRVKHDALQRTTAVEDHVAADRFLAGLGIDLDQHMKVSDITYWIGDEEIGPSIGTRSFNFFGAGAKDVMVMISPHRDQAVTWQDRNLKHAVFHARTRKI